MDEKEIIQHPTTVMWLVGLGVVVVSGLHVLLYRIMGIQITNNTASIKACVPRAEYEAFIKSTDQQLTDIKKGQDAMWGDVKKLLIRRRADREDQ